MGTSALFSDEEEFTDNQLVAGTLDLTVDWEEHYSFPQVYGADDPAGDLDVRHSEPADPNQYVGLPDPARPVVWVREDDLDAFMDNTAIEAFPDEAGPSGVQDDVSQYDACDDFANAPEDLDPNESLRTANQDTVSDDGSREPLINLDDVKPGDFGELTLSFHLCDNPGHVWLQAGNVDASENGLTEPERSAENEDGDTPSTSPADVELLDAIQTVWWYDDGNNVLESEEAVIRRGTLREVLDDLTFANGHLLDATPRATSSDPTTSACCADPFEASTTHHIGMAWWLPVDVGNDVQTDSVAFDLGLYTEQARHQECQLPECRTDQSNCTFEFSRTQNSPFEQPPDYPEDEPYNSENDGFGPNAAWENGLWYESNTGLVDLDIDASDCGYINSEPCCEGQIGVTMNLQTIVKTAYTGGGFEVVPIDSVSEDQFVETKPSTGDTRHMKPGTITTSEAQNAVSLEPIEDEDVPGAEATLEFDLSCEPGTYRKRFNLISTELGDRLRNGEFDGEVVPGHDLGEGALNRRPALIDIKFVVHDCGCDVDVEDIFFINFATAPAEVEWFRALLDEGGDVAEAVDESLPKVNGKDDSLPIEPRLARDVFRLAEVDGSCRGHETRARFPPRGPRDERQEDRTWTEFIDQLRTALQGGDIGGGDGGDGTGDDGIDDPDGYLSDANEYDGTVEDRTGEDPVIVDVGAGSGFAFDPPVIRVDAGTTVRWEWTGDGGDHDVVARDGTFSSSLKSTAGETFEHTFTGSGTTLYFCTPHEGVGMKGGVDVV